MAVTTYRSSDASASALSGTAGALITVLDACLVNGYGSQAAAGWTKAFSGTQTATYRQGTGSNQYYLHVNYNGPGAGTGKEARIFGSETASAVLTGTNLFPTVAQSTNGLFVRKSTTLDATQRPWVLVADQRTLYMWVQTGDSAGVYMGWMFGEYYSFKASDLGRTMIQARGTENVATLTSTVDSGDYMQGGSTLSVGHYMARDYTQAVGAVQFIKLGDGNVTTAAFGQALNGLLAVANPTDSRLYIAPLRLATTATSQTLRGRLRGLWHWCHPIAGVSDGDTFSGTNDLVGKTFHIIKQGGNSGLWVVETSTTWESN